MNILSSAWICWKYILIFIGFSYASEVLISREFTDYSFTTGQTSSWSPSSVFTCTATGNFEDYYSGATVVGTISTSETYTKTFTGLPVHWSLSVRFDMVLINSWYSSDKVNILIDGTQTDSYNKNGGGLQNNLCDSSSQALLILFNRNVTHTSSSVTIAIKAAYTSSSANTVFKNFFLYVDTCHYSCDTCSGPSRTDCVTCPANSRSSSATCTCLTGYVSHQGTCVTDCPAGYVISASQTVCIKDPCDANCSACNTIFKKCTACSSPYYLYQGACIAKCPITAPLTGGVCKDFTTTLTNGMYILNGLQTNYFGMSEITGLGITVTNFVGLAGQSDSSALTSECGNYHLLGGAFLASSSSIRVNFNSLQNSLIWICSQSSQNSTISFVRNPHWSVKIGYTLLKIDSWDWEYVDLVVDGYSVNRNNYNSNDGSSSFCGVQWNEKVVPITTNFTHSSSTMNVYFQGIFDEGAYNESFGIRDLYILIDFCTDNCNNCNAAGCTTCQSGYFMYYNKCYVVCPDGSYQSSSWACSDCVSPCATCTSSTSCLTCIASRYLSSSSCVTTCPVGTYNNDFTGNCDPCHTSCRSCVYPGNSISCVTCSGSYYLFINKCLTVCPDGYYKNTVTNNNQCLQCHSTCKTCNGPASTNCLTCLLPLYFESGPKTCVSPCSVGEYPRDSDATCQPCGGNCHTCDGPNPTDCTTCVSPYFLTSTGTCSTSCNTNQFPKTSNRVCTACDHSCTTCSEATSSDCLTCTLPRYFQYHTNQCNRVCLTSQFKSATPTPQCKDCDPSCLTCSGALDTQCLSCTGSKFLDSLTGKCSPTCPASYYANSSVHQCIACDPTCVSCNGGTAVDCLSCTTPLYLQPSQHQCVTATSCFTNQYAENSTHTCTACQVTCKTCSGPLINNCLSCSDPLFFNPINNKCVTACPIGYKGFQNVCTQCDLTCLTCSGPSKNQCLTCPTTLVKFATSCLPQCPKGYANVMQQCFECDDICKDSCVGTSKEDCDAIKPHYQLIVYILIGKTVLWITSAILGVTEDYASEGMKKPHRLKVFPLKSPNEIEPLAVEEIESNEDKGSQNPTNHRKKKGKPLDWVHNESATNIKGALQIVGTRNSQAQFGKSRKDRIKEGAYGLHNGNSSRAQKDGGQAKQLPIDPMSPIDTESEDNDHERYEHESNDQDSNSNDDNVVTNFQQPKKITKPKGPFKTNEKLKYSVLGNEWISLFYFYDPTIIRIIRTTIIYIKYQTFFFVTRNMTSYSYVAVSLLIGTAMKIILTLAYAQAAKFFRFSKFIAVSLFLIGVILFMSLWFIPQIDILKYTLDFDWSMIYIATACIDFFVLQQVFGFIRYMMTIHFLNESGNVNWLSRQLASQQLIDSIAYY